MRFFAAAIVVLISTAVSFAERRVALVFGADRYETIRPLANAVNDARAVEDALDALGFEVFSETNRNLKRMRRALEDFAEDAAGADVAFVFFAGHGVEIAGQNRLLPTDASTASLEALKASSLPLDELRETVARAAKIGLIVLDACRDDPFGMVSDAQGRGASALRLPKAVRPGLGRMGRAENTLFAFSAAPGETASDGEGNNSPFTSALTKYLGTDGLEIRSVLTLVQQEVYDQTRGNQLPYVESGLPSLFFASQTADELPERERLLLAMADVSPQMREDVERIASAADMPLAPLYGALIGSDIAGLNREERTDKLQEAAAAFTKVRDELRSLRSGDERVTALRRQAEEQLSLGAFDAARTKLTEAANIDATSRETLKANLIERTLSEAATHYLNGGAAQAELKYQLAIEDYEKAAALYGEVEGEDASDGDRFQHIVTLEALGDISVTTGDLAGAAAAFQSLLDVSQRRAEADENELRWRRYISVSYDKIGDVQVAQGDLSGAFQSYRSDLAITEQLIAAEPADAELQRDQSVTHIKLGGVLVAQGDLVGALEAQRTGLAIRERLANLDENNLEWQRDLAVSYDAVGNVLTKQGHLRRALDAYQSSFDIRVRLAASDPLNSRSQHDLSVSHDVIGDIHFAQDDLAGALAAYEAGLGIRERLVALDPDHTGWRFDLSVSHNNIGDVLSKQNDLTGALTSYRQAVAIREQLVVLDDANNDWRRNLAVSHNRIGGVLLLTGDLDGASAAYEANLTVARRLVEIDDSNAEWQRDLSVIHEKIGNLRLQREDIAGAVVAYSESLLIRRRLAATDPTNADWQRDLVVTHFKLAEAGDHPRDNYQRALDIAVSMRERGILAPADDFIPGLMQNRMEELGPREAAK